MSELTDRIRDDAEDRPMDSEIADLIDAIDALHAVSEFDDAICTECESVWPCETHLLLHPEDNK